MYEIKPFNESDLIKMTVNDKTRELIELVGIDNMVKGLNQGVSFTALHNGIPFAIGGISLLWSKVGEVWIMFGPDYLKHGFFIHRNTVKYLRKFIKDLGLERIQAAVLKDHWAGIEWINRLGFEFEGEMVKYFQGKTYLRYAKVRG